MALRFVYLSPFIPYRMTTAERDAEANWPDYAVIENTTVGRIQQFVDEEWVDVAEFYGTPADEDVLVWDIAELRFIPKTPAEYLAMLSGEAAAAFDLNSQKITGLTAGASSGEAVEYDQLHDAVTLSGAPNYITLSDQDIVRALIDLTSHVTGTLPVGNGGTGLTAPTDHSVLVGSGAGAITPVALGAGQVLVGASGADPAPTDLYETINFIIDGGGSVITTGVKGDVKVDFAGTITEWTIMPDQSGSIVIDIWKDTYANFPPTDADSMCSGKEPTLTATTKAQDTDITDWTTDDISAGDILRFNVDSITTCERVTLSLKVKRT
jgi:hypothetical protein